MDFTTTHADRSTTAPPTSTCGDMPEVAAVRSKLLEGLTTVSAFGAALGRCDRTIYAWISEGMPTVYVGRTPYIPINEARQWLLKPSARNSPARKPGRPAKKAA